METYIWKYGYLSFVCNVGSLQEARKSFDVSYENTKGKPGIDDDEMKILKGIVNTEFPVAVFGDGLCAILTRTKYDIEPQELKNTQRLFDSFMLNNAAATRAYKDDEGIIRFETLSAADCADLMQKVRKGEKIPDSISIVEGENQLPKFK